MCNTSISKAPSPTSSLGCLRAPSFGWLQVWFKSSAVSRHLVHASQTPDVEQLLVQHPCNIRHALAMSCACITTCITAHSTPNTGPWQASTSLQSCLGIALRRTGSGHGHGQSLRFQHRASNCNSESSRMTSLASAPPQNPGTRVAPAPRTRRRAACTVNAARATNQEPAWSQVERVECYASANSGPRLCTWPGAAMLAVALAVAPVDSSAANTFYGGPALGLT